MTARGLPVAIDDGDGLAPPRRNGELIFAAPWEGRAFGMCVALLEREGRSWNDFRVFLAEAIEEAPEVPYYEAFVVALDRFATALDML